MRIIIYTRQGCPLCEKGIRSAEAVFGADEIELVDVDLDLALMEKYTYRVPVVETADGTVIDEGIVSEAALKAFLEAAAT